jgi:hypothetical protein
MAIMLVNQRNRLITALQADKTRLFSHPRPSRARVIPRAEYIGYAVDTGYKDFPAPDELCL